MDIDFIYGFDHLPDCDNFATFPSLQSVKSIKTFIDRFWGYSSGWTNISIGSMTVDGDTYKGIKTASTSSPYCGPFSLKLIYNPEKKTYLGFRISALSWIPGRFIWIGLGSALFTVADLKIPYAAGSYYFEIVLIPSNATTFTFEIYLNGTLAGTKVVAKDTTLNVGTVTTGETFGAPGTVFSDFYGATSPLDQPTTPLGPIRVDSHLPINVSNPQNLNATSGNKTPVQELSSYYRDKLLTKNTHCTLLDPGVESIVEFAPVTKPVVATAILAATTKGAKASSGIRLKFEDNDGVVSDLNFNPVPADGVNHTENLVIQKKANPLTPELASSFKLKVSY